MGILQRQGIKNTVIIYLGILIGFISLVIIQPLYLDKSEIGLTRLLLAFSSLFSSIFSFSISNITVKFFPYFKDYSKKHNGFFGFTLLIPFAGSLLGCSLLFIFKDSIVEYYSKDSKIFVQFFYHTFLFSFILAMILALNSYCNALLKTTVPSFLNDVITRIVFICLILLYAFKLINFNHFVLFFILSYALQAALLVVYIYKYACPSFVVNLNLVRKIGIQHIAKYGAILTITTLTSFGIKFLDMIMIGHYKQDADVGVYSIAAFIATVIETPLNSLERIANPKIAHALAENNLKEVQNIYFKSTRYLSIIGGLLAILVILNIKELLTLLPNDFSGGIIVTVIMSIGAFINMFTGVNFPILFNSKKYYIGSVFIGIMLIISFVMNMILIPPYGIMGAAIAAFTSSVIFNILKFVFIWKEFKMQPYGFYSLKILFIIVICLTAGSFTLLTSNHILNIIINGSIVTALYLSLTYLFNITPEFHRYIPFIGKQLK